MRPTPATAPCCYDTIVSREPDRQLHRDREGRDPAARVFGTLPVLPGVLRLGWVETQPVGVTRTYFGESVYDGAYPYNGTRVTPSWGGSMFEALMPALFVPEERWGPGSWGANHPLTVRAQIHHGMTEAGYGYWGFSPANIPEGGYDAYGVDAIGMNPDGYPSNEDQTRVDHGYAGCPDREPQPDRRSRRTRTASSRRTPRSSACARRRSEAVDEPAPARARLPRHVRRGASATRSTSTPAWSRTSYLSLDQGIVMAAIGNALGDDLLRHAFVTRRPSGRVRPVIGVEEFTSPRAAARSRAPTATTGCAGRRATTSSAASAATTGSTGAAATTPCSATPARPDRRRGRRRHPVRRRRRRRPVGWLRRRRPVGWPRRRPPRRRARRRLPRGRRGDRPVPGVLH